MKYSISKASKIVGVTRKTFYKHIDKKGISVEKDENDRPVIDASELIRIYGDQCQFDLDSKKEDPEQGSDKEKPPVKAEESADIAVALKELEMLKSQMATERDGFEEQIDYLRNKLDEANSETRKLTALITDERTNRHNGAGEWEKSIKALEQRIANQEKSEKEREEREQKILRQNQSLRKALKAEREKGLFQKFFGVG